MGYTKTPFVARWCEASGEVVTGCARRSATSPGRGVKPPAIGLSPKSPQVVAPCNRPLWGFATHGEMPLRRRRQVARGRSSSREAVARGGANTPSASECRAAAKQNLLRHHHPEEVRGIAAGKHPGVACRPQALRKPHGSALRTAKIVNQEVPC